jgi:type IV secretory pathway VirB10-like protein
MKKIASLFLWATLCLPGFAGQQTSPSSPHGNPQDVPKQKPGTDNPDVGKGMRPTPDNPPAKNKDDVPEQKPGTDNPDVAKDNRSNKPDTSTNGSSKSKSKAKKKTQSSSTSSLD